MFLHELHGKMSSHHTKVNKRNNIKIRKNHGKVLNYTLKFVFVFFVIFLFLSMPFVQVVFVRAEGSNSGGGATSSEVGCCKLKSECYPNVLESECDGIFFDDPSCSSIDECSVGCCVVPSSSGYASCLYKLQSSDGLMNKKVCDSFGGVFYKGVLGYDCESMCNPNYNPPTQKECSELGGVLCNIEEKECVDNEGFPARTVYSKDSTSGVLCCLGDCVVLKRCSSTSECDIKNCEVCYDKFNRRLSSQEGFNPSLGMCTLSSRKQLEGFACDLDCQCKQGSGLSCSEGRHICTRQCSDSSECDNNYYNGCGVCYDLDKDGVKHCVASSRQQEIGMGCDKDCQCKSGVCDKTIHKCVLYDPTKSFIKSVKIKPKSGNFYTNFQIFVETNGRVKSVRAIVRRFLSSVEEYNEEFELDKSGSSSFVSKTFTVPQLGRFIVDLEFITYSGERRVFPNAEEFVVSPVSESDELEILLPDIGKVPRSKIEILGTRAIVYGSSYVEDLNPSTAELAGKSFIFALNKVFSIPNKAIELLREGILFMIPSGNAHPSLSYAVSRTIDLSKYSEIKKEIEFIDNEINSFDWRLNNIDRGDYPRFNQEDYSLEIGESYFKAVIKREILRRDLSRWIQEVLTKVQLILLIEGMLDDIANARLALHEYSEANVKDAKYYPEKLLSELRKEDSTFNEYFTYMTQYVYGIDGRMPGLMQLLNDELPKPLSLEDVTGVDNDLKEYKNYYTLLIAKFIHENNFFDSKYNDDYLGLIRKAYKEKYGEELKISVGSTTGYQVHSLMESIDKYYSLYIKKALSSKVLEDIGLLYSANRNSQIYIPSVVIKEYVDYQSLIKVLSIDTANSLLRKEGIDVFDLDSKSIRELQEISDRLAPIRDSYLDKAFGKYYTATSKGNKFYFKLKSDVNLDSLTTYEKLVVILLPHLRQIPTAPSYFERILAVQNLKQLVNHPGMWPDATTDQKWECLGQYNKIVTVVNMAIDSFLFFVATYGITSLMKSAQVQEALTKLKSSEWYVSMKESNVYKLLFETDVKDIVNNPRVLLRRMIRRMTTEEPIDVYPLYLSSDDLAGAYSNVNKAYNLNLDPKNLRTTIDNIIKAINKDRLYVNDNLIIHDHGPEMQFILKKAKSIIRGNFGGKLDNLNDVYYFLERYHNFMKETYGQYAHELLKKNENVYTELWNILKQNGVKNLEGGKPIPYDYLLQAARNRWISGPGVCRHQATITEWLFEQLRKEGLLDKNIKTYYTVTRNPIPTYVGRRNFYNHAFVTVRDKKYKNIGVIFDLTRGSKSDALLYISPNTWYQAMEKIGRENFNLYYGPPAAAIINGQTFSSIIGAQGITQSQKIALVAATIGIGTFFTATMFYAMIVTSPSPSSRIHNIPHTTYSEKRRKVLQEATDEVYTTTLKLIKTSVKEYKGTKYIRNVYLKQIKKNGKVVKTEIVIKLKKED